MLAGGVVAGFTGPALSYFGRTLFPGARYAGSFWPCRAWRCSAFSFSRRHGFRGRKPGRGTLAGVPISPSFVSPDVFIPIVAGMASYGLMISSWSPRPLAMVLLCGHTNEDATFAIQWHIVAMFAPSFITGSIVARIGARMTAGIGLFLILGGAWWRSTASPPGISIWRWCFWASGGIRLYRRHGTSGAELQAEDAARVQALNEQLVFGMMALGSIGSGFMLQTLGWQALNVLAIPVATFAIALLAWGDWRANEKGYS